MPIIQCDIRRGRTETQLRQLASGLMPPFLVLRDFLDGASVTGLLDHAISRQTQFTPTGVGSAPGGALIDPSISGAARSRRQYRRRMF